MGGGDGNNLAAVKLIAESTKLYVLTCYCFVQADKQYEDEKRRESEAMRYWEEKKREEQVQCM